MYLVVGTRTVWWDDPPSEFHNLGRSPRNHFLPSMPRQTLPETSTLYVRVCGLAVQTMAVFEGVLWIDRGCGYARSAPIACMADRSAYMRERDCTGHPLLDLLQLYFNSDYIFLLMTKACLV